MSISRAARASSKASAIKSDGQQQNGADLYAKLVQVQFAWMKPTLVVDRTHRGAREFPAVQWARGGVKKREERVRSGAAQRLRSNTASVFRAERRSGTYGCSTVGSRYTIAHSCNPMHPNDGSPPPAPRRGYSTAPPEVRRAMRRERLGGSDSRCVSSDERAPGESVAGRRFEDDIESGQTSAKEGPARTSSTRKRKS